MGSNVKITFFLFKAKRNSKKQIPVYMRVWHNYKYFVKSTGIVVGSINDWDRKGMRIKGKSLEANSSNSHLEVLKMKVLQIVNQLIVSGKPINTNIIKNMLNDNSANKVTLMKICEEQLSEMRKLKGKDFAPSTIIKYKNTKRRLQQFIKFKYKTTDLFLYELNYQFISDFISYLKSEKDNGATTCFKHAQRLSRFINKAIQCGYIDKSPFTNFKIRLPQKAIQYLTQEEIDRIAQLDLKVERLSITRDIFIFCVYSSLGYAEVESLSPDNITTGMDGDLWLNIQRKKTRKNYQIPLFQKAIEILEKYKSHPTCLKRSRCLPVMSNQKLNSFLKEVGELAKIPQSKPLVSHLARKTFACTIGLKNGMNIAVISRILGHSSIQITLQSYATVIDELMMTNVKELKNKLRY